MYLHLYILFIGRPASYQLVVVTDAATDRVSVPVLFAVVETVCAASASTIAASASVAKAASIPNEHTLQIEVADSCSDDTRHETVSSKREKNEVLC
jgi:hypothetical protein